MRLTAEQIETGAKLNDELLADNARMMESIRDRLPDGVLTELCGSHMLRLSEMNAARQTDLDLFIRLTDFFGEMQRHCQVSYEGPDKESKQRALACLASTLFVDPIVAQCFALTTEGQYELRLMKKEQPPCDSPPSP